MRRPEQLQLYVLTRTAHVTYVIRWGGFLVEAVTSNRAASSLSLRWEPTFLKERPANRGPGDWLFLSQTLGFLLTEAQPSHRQT